ncbi:hypothetical protein BC628DRAFT_1465406 [Trametes gibbosa]|nr:hypothetical protein BC628DRAFT_1465406 [Trametes gibbosa]
MHQTHSWRLAVGEHMKAKEHSHMRMVTNTVGRPLMLFKSTKELVMAIYDAICGHQTLMERCGILHWDVSNGNILIVENQPRERVPCVGILHDYDYSSMMLYHPLANGPSATTGTYYFIAVELLHPEITDILHDVHHDLESFIWVLLWIVLHHTAHRHSSGAEACSNVFKFGNDQSATDVKQAWIVNRAATPLIIANNALLMDLLKELHKSMFEAIITKEHKLTYAGILSAFKSAIDRKDWPVRDAAVPFVPPKPEDSMPTDAPKKRTHRQFKNDEDEEESEDPFLTLDHCQRVFSHALSS